MTCYIIENRFTEQRAMIIGYYEDDAFARWNLNRAEWFILESF